MWIAIQNAVGARQGVGGGPGPGPGYTPPLDAYPATAAYSVRKLSSTYSGSCIEAYRVSDGVTQDIGFDADGLIDTAAIVAFGGVSEVRVRTWYDQSGNTLDAVQTASANMARIYDGSSIYEDNGNPAVDFNNNQFFSIGSSQWTDGAMMASIVFSRRSGNDTYWTSNGSVWRLFYESAAHGFIHYGTTPVTTRKLAPPGSAPVLTIARFGQGSADLYENGISVGSSPTVTGSMSTASVPAFMAQRSDGNLRMDGTIQELIHWGSDQTDNRTGVESNINSYFQIANLPATTGFLADYPDSAAAYSVRQLSNNAIKCMRVRRAVAPFDEKDIGFTAGGDLDEAAIVAFGGSDVLVVSAWFDQSGQSRHATQITPGKQPQIYNGTAVVTENGKPALDFDGTSTTMSASTSLTNAVTIFLVYRRDTTTGNYILDGDNSTRLAVGGVTLTTQFQVYVSSGLIGLSDILNQQNLGYVLANGANSEVALNGNTATTGNSGNAVNTSTIWLGSRLGGSGFLQGKMQEVVYYDFNQTSPTNNRTAIETNIMTYYNIP